MFASAVLLPLSAAFAGLASASPVNVQRQTAIPENWTWLISGFTAGCGRQSCNYNFNVTVPSVPGKILGVQAYCSGGSFYDTNPIPESTYKPCQLLPGVNSDVSAKFGPLPTEFFEGEGPEKIFVSFLLPPYIVDGEVQRPGYNYTGSGNVVYNAGTAPPRDFDIIPTQVTTVE